MLKNRSGPTTSTVWPAERSSRSVFCSVTTTPLICGVQASLASKIRKGHLLGLLGRILAHVHRRQVVPVKDAQAAVAAFDERGQALNPVAVIAVEDAVDVADFGFVDVTADHTLRAAPPRFGRHRALKVDDV